MARGVSATSRGVLFRAGDREGGFCRNDIFCAELDFRSHNPTSGGHKTNSNCSAVPASYSIKWLPPPCNLVKPNFDGSVCHNKKTATGFVVRDHEGNPILAGSRCVGNSSVPITEYSALRDGLFHALCNDIRRVQVDDDSKLIIDLINNRSPPP
ncbi:hypothetical protein ACLB2K_016723 [Fragaria x ananassa]